MDDCGLASINCDFGVGWFGTDEVISSVRANVYHKVIRDKISRSRGIGQSALGIRRERQKLFTV